MCDQRDAMRQVRAAAECLSGACRFGEAPAARPLIELYDAVLEEPIPTELLDLVDELHGRSPRPRH